MVEAQGIMTLLLWLYHNKATRWQQRHGLKKDAWQEVAIFRQRRLWPLKIWILFLGFFIVKHCGVFGAKFCIFRQKIFGQDCKKIFWQFFDSPKFKGAWPLSPPPGHDVSARCRHIILLKGKLYGVNSGAVGWVLLCPVQAVMILL